MSPNFNGSGATPWEYHCHIIPALKGRDTRRLMGHSRSTDFPLRTNMLPLQGLNWSFRYFQGVARGFIISAFQATHPGASQTPMRSSKDVGTPVIPKPRP
jgi:hypothetical protein